MSSSQPGQQLNGISGEHAGSWRLFQLPDELLTRVLAQLPPNDIACNVRLVCRDASAQLKGLQHITVSVGDKPARSRSTDEPELVVPAHALLSRWGHLGAGAGLTYDHRRQLLCQAARTGSISTLDQLSRSLGCLIPAAVLLSGASAGQLDVCRWLLQHPDRPHHVAGEPSRSSDLVREAVRSGNTELVSALLDMDYQVKVQDLHCAVESGNRAMCEWLAARGCPWAAEGDNRYSVSLYENLPAAAAARKGDLQLLAWALSRGKDDGSVHLPHGAAGKLLSHVAHGCPLSTLQQLYQELFPARWGEDGAVNSWDANDILAGAACSPTPDWRDKVLWLASQAPQLPLKAPALVGDLAQCKEDAVARVQWLRERGLLLTEPDVGWMLALCAAGYGNLQLLEYLMVKGLPDLPQGREAGAGVGRRAGAQGYESEEDWEEGYSDGEEAGDGERLVGWGWQAGSGVEEEGESDDEGEEEDEEAAGGAGAGDEAGVGQAAAVGAGGEGNTCDDRGQVTAAAAEAALQAPGDQAVQAAEEDEDEEEGQEEWEEASEGESDGYVVDDWERSRRGESGWVIVALGGGHLHVLRALHARGVSMAGCSGVQAAAKGDLPLVQWLMEVQGRLPPSSSGGREQVRHQGGVGAGQQEQAAGTAEGALKLLNRRRRRLTGRVLDGAVHSRREEVVRWLRGVGCPWSCGALAEMAWWGSEELLEWAVEEGCPVPNDFKVYTGAAVNGDLALLSCLRRLGCPWGPDPTALVIHMALSYPCRLPVLQWFAEQGLPADWRAVQERLHSKGSGLRPDVVKWVGEMAAGQGEE